MQFAGDTEINLPNLSVKQITLSYTNCTFYIARSNAFLSSNVFVLYVPGPQFITIISSTIFIPP